MLELVKAGGWLMLPIILSSILALAICVERYLALNPDKVAPRSLAQSGLGVDAEQAARQRKVAPSCARARRWARSSPPGWATPSTVARL